MKAKKFLSAVLSAAMCCSFLTANVSADEFDLPVPTESYISLTEEKVNENNISVSKLPDGSLLEGIETISEKPYGISTYSNSSDVSTYANADFVMELAYYVVNPESMINGAFTTDTLVYWFWTYNGVNYTYDPAGYDIVGYAVVGIDENEYDYLWDSDNNPIGFVTLFSEAGQHTFGYYAVNSNGDVCYKEFTRNIEPADGNNRPVGNLQVSSGPYYNNTNIVFSWSNSSDADSGDYIVGARVRVYDKDYVLLTEGSDYSLSMDNQNKRFTLNFVNTGIHRVYISVSDNHNNWSNWIGGSINVQEKIDLEDVVLTSRDVNNTNSSRFTWYDFNEAEDLQYQTSNAQGLYDMLTSNDVPEKVRRTTIIGGEWTVSGYVKSSTGEPVANATVKITIPMGEDDFNASVKTNSSGYFSYTCSSLTQWFKARNLEYEAKVPVNTKIFGHFSRWCRYGDLKTTSWFMVTDMYITCEAAGVQTSIPVSALSGCSFAKWLGTRWIDGIPGDSSYGWFDLG